MEPGDSRTRANSVQFPYGTASTEAINGIEGQRLSVCRWQRCKQTASTCARTSPVRQDHVRKRAKRG
jgi:hypothetical protein